MSAGDRFLEAMRDFAQTESDVKSKAANFNVDRYQRAVEAHLLKNEQAAAFLSAGTAVAGLPTAYSQLKTASVKAYNQFKDYREGRSISSAAQDENARPPPTEMQDLPAQPINSTQTPTTPATTPGASSTSLQEGRAAVSASTDAAEAGAAATTETSAIRSGVSNAARSIVGDAAVDAGAEAAGVAGSLISTAASFATPVTALVSVGIGIEQLIKAFTKKEPKPAEPKLNPNRQAAIAPTMDNSRGSTSNAAF